MSLIDEIRADIHSGDLDDLFRSVTYNGQAVVAMVETASTVDSFDAMGGPMLVGERDFKFRRADLEAIRVNFQSIGAVIVYGPETYNVRQIDTRPGHPIVTMRAELRA